MVPCLATSAGGVVRAQGRPALTGYLLPRSSGFWMSSPQPPPCAASMTCEWLPWVLAPTEEHVGGGGGWASDSLFSVGGFLPGVPWASQWRFGSLWRDPSSPEQRERRAGRGGRGFVGCVLSASCFACYSALTAPRHHCQSSQGWHQLPWAFPGGPDMGLGLEAPSGMKQGSGSLGCLANGVDRQNQNIPLLNAWLG